MSSMDIIALLFVTALVVGGGLWIASRDTKTVEDQKKIAEVDPELGTDVFPPTGKSSVAIGAQA